ncbi:hypothetical protein JCM33374_g4566 [Metschnikowia sp. JCM 33374]|nr:hypothetical protein JCM33374_g4566 [Metschnikowia sp. JCM 33374]
MNLAAILIMLAWVSANTPNLGTLVVSTIFGEGVQKHLRIVQNYVVANDQMTAFEYQKTGAFKRFNTGQYLSINGAGRLVISKIPHRGFSLSRSEQSDFKKFVSYKGRYLFELCGDGRIGFQSHCKGAREVSLTFAEVF